MPWHSSGRELGPFGWKAVECPKHRGGEGVNGHLKLCWVLCKRGYVRGYVEIQSDFIYLFVLACFPGGQPAVIGAILASLETFGPMIWRYQKVWVRALTGVIVLCSWERHFTVTVHLSAQEYKWVHANCQRNVTKCWGVICDGLASHPGDWSRNIPCRLMLGNRDKLRRCGSLGSCTRLYLYLNNSMSLFSSDKFKSSLSISSNSFAGLTLFWLSSP